MMPKKLSANRRGESATMSRMAYSVVKMATVTTSTSQSS